MNESPQYKAVAAKALAACLEINPENPMAVAENIKAMWSLLEDKALPAIEVEAARRETALAPGRDVYWREMHDIADAIHELAINMLRSETEGGGEMAKLVIMVTEDVKECGPKTVVGFEVKQGVSFDDDKQRDASQLPMLAYILPRVVLLAIHMVTTDTGAECHRLDFDAQKVDTLETAMKILMGEIAEKLERADDFPEELEEK